MKVIHVYFHFYYSQSWIKYGDVSTICNLFSALSFDFCRKNQVIIVSCVSRLFSIIELWPLCSELAKLENLFAILDRAYPMELELLLTVLLRPSRPASWNKENTAVLYYLIRTLAVITSKYYYLGILPKFTGCLAGPVCPNTPDWLDQSC